VSLAKVLRHEHVPFSSDAGLALKEVTLPGFARVDDAAEARGSNGAVIPCARDSPPGPVQRTPGVNCGDDSVQRSQYLMVRRCYRSVELAGMGKTKRYRNTQGLHSRLRRTVTKFPVRVMAVLREVFALSPDLIVVAAEATRNRS
jgi:hypothetical protein